MFILTVLVYPCVLAALCMGAGLLVDRSCGAWLPGALLAAVGAAALIAVSQLSTYVVALAPATPYLMVAFSLAGFALAGPRARALVRGWRAQRWPLAVAVLVYLLALAPVVLAGRQTFSSFMALADSAVHMLGADYLMRHGQDYAHLDLRNSYGQFVNAYYNMSYPSGSDTLFGGSARLLGLPEIWAFQPFNAFILATAAGPAWVLVRRVGLDKAWAAVATLSVTVPALVYGYELVGSIKELTALSMILALGALVVVHERWLWRGARGAIPAAVLVAGGVSALGVGFGAWALATACVLLVLVLAGVLATGRGARAALALLGAGVIVTLVCAWPTWANLSGSLNVAQNIASTGNPGNLRTPLRTVQVFGVWLRGSYKQPPAGLDRVLTDALIAITACACLLGVVHLLRIRARALAGWLALMLAVWLGLSVYATTWVQGKTLMLSSPAVVLLAWAGLAGLRAWAGRTTELRATEPRGGPGRRMLAWVAAALALALAGGVLASDLMQYHSSNLAPTARYEELASLNRRFAGRGPTLFTDFDEYALYELRDLDVGGPDFAYPPSAVAGAAGGYGDPVKLDRVRPEALQAYPLIITRRDPSAARPPAAYALLWQGSYYQVWSRRSGAPAAIAHRALSASVAARCTQLGAEARIAARRGAQLVAYEPPALVRISLAGAARPARWGRQRGGLVMSAPGRLAAPFAVPSAGAWDVWVQGQIMPTISLAVDGRALASIGGQLSGNSLVPDTVPPSRVRLSAGAHRLSVTRGGFTLAPGDGGSAVLDGIFLTPAGSDQGVVRRLTPAEVGRSCGRPFAWSELLPG